MVKTPKVRLHNVPARKWRKERPDMEQVLIRPLADDDWDQAMALIWRVFLRCNAGDYEQEGIESFLNFISDEHLRMFCRLDEFEMLGAYLGNRLIGACLLRQSTHISLLFVDTDYHRQGVGRQMIGCAADLVRQRGGGSLSVNATPFALDFYHGLGFTDTDKEQVKEGIRFVPMVLLLKKKQKIILTI